MRETELRRAVTVGELHVNRPHRPLAGRVIVQHRLKMDSGAQMRSGCCAKHSSAVLQGVLLCGCFWRNATGLKSLRSRIKKVSGVELTLVLCNNPGSGGTKYRGIVVRGFRARCGRRLRHLRVHGDAERDRIRMLRLLSGAGGSGDCARNACGKHQGYRRKRNLDNPYGTP